MNTSLNRVCAVVVTYQPDGEVAGNLTALTNEVQGIVVIDNNSDARLFEPVSGAIQKLGCKLIRISQNVGLAAAQNLGIQWAIEYQFDWVLLLDQDSTLQAGFVDSMLTCYASHPNASNIGLIGSAYKHKGTGEVRTQTPHLGIMSSGSLLPCAVFERCGFLREDLFIDLVDYEFCFRLNDCGYLTTCCPDAILLHAAGDPSSFNLFGKRIFSFREHNWLRHYYMTRNGLLLLKSYGRRYPRWALSWIVQTVFKMPLKIVIGQNRMAKMRYVFKGAADGMRGRSGKLVV